MALQTQSKRSWYTATIVGLFGAVTALLVSLLPMGRSSVVAAAGTGVPTISIKTSDGLSDGSHSVNGAYDRISFMLQDQEGDLASVTLGTGSYDLTGKQADLNWASINSVHLKQGQNTAVVSDAAGNTASLTFNFDTQGPIITVKPDSVGSGSTFSRVSFSVSDAAHVSAVRVNGGDWREVTPSEQSDVDAIAVGENGGVLGANRLEVRDGLGNISQFDFTLDNIAPLIIGVSDGEERATTLERVTVSDQNFASASLNDLSLPCTADEIGVWTCQVNLAVSGEYTLKVTDLAGNAAQVTFAVKLAAPSAPANEEPVTTDSATPDITIGTPDPLPQTTLSAPSVTRPFFGSSTLSRFSGSRANETSTQNRTLIDDGEVVGTFDPSAAPLSQSASTTVASAGWQLWGVAWYWYVAVAGVLAALWLMMLSRSRKNPPRQASATKVFDV